MRAVFYVAVMLASTAASAQTLQRCVIDGKTVYTDRACAPGTKVADVRVTDNTVDLSAEKRIAERNQEERDAARAPAGAKNSGDCDYALSKYKQLTKSRELAVGRQKFEKIELTAEAAAVRTHCGPDVLPAARKEKMQAPPHKKPEMQIVDTKGGFYQPTAGGYISPRGEFCPKAAGGLACPSGFVPVN